MLSKIDQWLDANAVLFGYLSALFCAGTGAYVIWVCIGVGLARQGY